jgi:hypothetical protein
VLGSTGHIMMVLSKLKNIKVSGVSSLSLTEDEKAI